MKNYLKKNVYTIGGTTYKVAEVRFVDTFTKLANFVSKGGVPTQEQLIKWRSLERSHPGGFTALMTDISNIYGRDMIVSESRAGNWYAINGISCDIADGEAAMPIYTCIMGKRANFEPKVMIRLEVVK